MFHHSKIFLAAAVMALSTSAASAATVGFDPIDRANADGFSNFAIAMTDAVFPTGTFTSWSTFIESIDGNAQTGSVSLLVLSDAGGGNYNVVDIDTRNAVVGLNTFYHTFGATVGNILATLIGTAKVSYDLVPGASNSVGPDPYSPNGVFGVLPGIGDMIALNGGGTNRQYSILAAVPLPAGGILLIGALGGLAAFRRRKTA